MPEIMKDIITEIQELYEEGNWLKIIETYHCHPERNKLLWVYPSVENFQFIKDSLEWLHCDRLLSIGCGSGLLEWMINEATGIPTSGLEVDSTWWNSKHAPPTFTPLLFTSGALDKDTISLLQNSDSTVFSRAPQTYTTSMALLFCYFNNMAAFREYLKHFSGKVLIIIGPDNKGVHTEPQPFSEIEGWELFGSQEVRNSRDFIAIYCKSV